MKTNEKLGFNEQIVRVGNYDVGCNAAGKYRGHGYEWDNHEDASIEQSHHDVCGRGETASEAIDKMMYAAEAIGGIDETVHNMQTVRGLTSAEVHRLRLELIERLDSLDDAQCEE